MKGGTGTAAAIPGITVSGKTGSAQRVSNDLRKSGKLDKDELKDNGWFVAFAPRENPEIVLAVLLEGGEHGGSGRAHRARRHQSLLRQEDPPVKIASPVWRSFSGPATVGQAILSPVAPRRSDAASGSRTTKMARYRSFRDLDWSMLIITLIICAWGFCRSIPRPTNTKWSDAWWKQSIWIAGGHRDHVGGLVHRLSHPAGAGPHPLWTLDRRPAGDLRSRKAWYSVPAAGSGCPGSGSTFRSPNSLNW